MAIKEEIYDSQISPLMTQIIAIAEANEIDFIASFELGLVPDRGDEQREAEADVVTPLHCSTYINKKQYPRLIFMDMARQADLNADALIMGLMRYAREHGNHSSACLKLLGVPIDGESPSS